jgi:hypothetical protein
MMRLSDTLLLENRLPKRLLQAHILRLSWMSRRSFSVHNNRDGIRFEHWKNELSNALRAGKTVFLLLSDKEEFYVDTGIRSYSGSGRNRSTTVNVQSGNNYDFLPTNIGQIIPASGKQIVFTGSPIFQNFYEKFKDNLEYRLCLENVPRGENIFIGKDKSRVLGSVIGVSGGDLTLLPFLDYNEENFTECF